MEIYLEAEIITAEGALDNVGGGKDPSIEEISLSLSSTYTRRFCEDDDKQIFFILRTSNLGPSKGRPNRSRPIEARPSPRSIL